MADPEVNIKFTADSGNVPPSIDRLKELFDDLTQRVEDSDAALQDMSGDVKRVSDAASSMKSTAEATGNANVQEQVNRAFDAGATRVQEYQEDLVRLGTEMQKLKERAQGVMEAVQEGNMSYDAGLAKMEKMAKASEKGAGSVQKLGAATRNAMEDLGKAGGLQNALSGWTELSRAITIAQKESNSQKLLLEEMKEQLRQQRLALDKNSAGYEQQVAEIMQAEEALKAYAAQIRTVNEQLSKQQGGLGNVWGTAEKPASTGDVNGAIEKEYEALDKLMQKASTVESRMALDTQKRAAAQEKAAEKAEAAAEREAAAKEKAAEKAEAAAEKEAAAQEAAAYAMQLAAMSKNKLAAETRRLIAERKKAAAAGDAEAYKRLTAQLGQCRTAMRSLSQSAQMNKIALMQQAQTAAMVGGQLQGLGSQITGMGKAAKNGELNVTGLATSFISLRMALKAGMGPLGWVMLAIEGLQMAWNTYAKEAKAAEERTLKLAEAEEKLTDKLKGVAKAEADRRIEIMKSRWEMENAAREYAQQIDEASAKASDNQAKAQVESAANAANQEIAIERSKLADMRKLGQVSEDEYSRRMVELARREREIAQETQTKLDAINVEGARRRADTTGEELQKAQDRVAEEEQKFGEKWQYAGDEQVEKLISNIESIKGEQEGLKAKIENVKDVAEINSSLWKDIQKCWGILAENIDPIGMKMGRTTIAEAKNRIVAEEEKTEEALKKLNNDLVLSTKDLNDAYKELADKLHMSVDDAKKFIGERESIRAQKKAVEAAQRKADVADHSANLEKEAAEREQKENKKQYEGKEKITRSIEEAQLATEATLRARKDELEKVQRTGSLEEQKRVLKEQRAEMQKGSDAWKKYTAQIRSINQKMREEKLSELARTAGPKAVIAELERLRTHCKEGSEAWKKYTSQIRQLEVKGIREGLSEFKRQLEISTTYQKQDSRTQAEIYHADRRRLAALAAELRRQIAATDDYALRKELREQLRDTVEQQRNLRSALAKSAKEAYKDLMQRKRETPEAKNKGANYNLKSAWARYQAAVDKTTKLTIEAGKGSEEERRAKLAAAKKAWERAKKENEIAQKYAKDPAELREHLDSMRKNLQTSNEYIIARREMTAQTRKEKNANAAAAQKEKLASDELAAAKKAEAQERRSNSGKSARPQQQDTQQAALQQAQQQAAAAKAAAEQAQAALAALTQVLPGFMAAHQSLLEASSGVVNSLDSLAGRTTAAVDDLSSKIRTIEDKIARLFAKVR